MRLADIIREGRDAPLYHSTLLPAAVAILRDGFIRRFPTDHGGITTHGVSLTRDPRLRYGNNGSFPTTRGRGQVQFVVDQAAVARRFKMTPFSWEGALGQRTWTPPHKQRGEAEELVHSDIPVTARFVRQIIIEPTADDPDLTEEVIRMAGVAGIPVTDKRRKQSPLESDLNRLQILAASKDVRLRVTIKDPKRLNLDLIERRKDAERGSGAEVMQALCDIADKHRMRIDLYSYEAHPKLEEFYGRFGFEIDPRGNDEAMLRRMPRRK